MLGSNLRRLKRIKGLVTKKQREMAMDEDLPPKHKKADKEQEEEEKTRPLKHKKKEDYTIENRKGTTQLGSVGLEHNISLGEEEDLNFEDPYDDEWGNDDHFYLFDCHLEEEEIVNNEQFEEEKIEEGNEEEGSYTDRSGELVREFSELKFSDEPVVLLDDDLEDRKRKKKQEEETKAFLGTEKNLKEGEFLDFDNRAYDLFHRARTPWPCLSLDILVPRHKRNMPINPTKVDIKNYPLTVYVVAGSQAATKEDNALYVMKWSHLHKTRYDDDSDVVDEEDIDADEDPRLDVLSINHTEGINRVRSMNGTGIVALWDEAGRVCIYDTTRHIDKLVEYNVNEEEMEDDEGPNPTPKGLQPPRDMTKRNFMLNEFKHLNEGFAVDWSPINRGLLATGGCDKRIYLYRPADETISSWVIDSQPYTVHSGSVEDIQFSKDNENLLASCSTDGTIKFIDFRIQYRNECHSHIEVSETDVNVLSWSNASPNLIASGSDDGKIQIWDIRYLHKTRSVAEIQFHTAPITSIEFEPYEESVLTVGSADNRVTIWDFSVEPEAGNKENEIPDQLMFIHQGLEDVKEVKHHTYMSDLVLSTSANGFNIFKPNYEEDWDEETN